MFVHILLGLFCIQMVSSKVSDVPVANYTQEFDDFIALFATPVKDEFDWKLLQKFTSAKGYENVILSPVSLKLVLALLYEGAAGPTAKEFQNILNFPVDKISLRRNYSQLLDELILKRKNYIINIGTQLYLDSHLRVENTFGGIASTYYGSKVIPTNFSNPQEASSNINIWVEYLTNGRIKSLVTPDDVENAVLLAANVIYFKGIWSLPFPNNASFTGGFYTSSTKSVRVPFMTLTEKFFYANSKSLDAEILRLPYKDKRIALYIILPHSKSGLPSLIDDLDLTQLTLSVRNMEQRPVQVILPKFRFDFQARYSKILREFGFDSLFRGVSSFPGIVRDQEIQLIVTDILQKSGIDVNEEGSEIYTAIHVTLGNKFGENIVVFNASRPFLFYIQEEVTQNILFIGKVENPLDMGYNSPPLAHAPLAHTPLAHAVTPPPSVPLSEPNQYQPSAPTNSQFDLQLLRNAIGTSKNVFLSPSGIKIALATLAEGGSGRTSEEIYSALHIQSDVRNKVLQSLISELSESHPHSTLEFQNALFVSDKERIKSQYQNIVERYYKALVKHVNYHNPQYAANEINDFVKNATRGYIPSILSTDDINPDTEIILANALYFKASWLKTFDKKITKTGCFQAPRGCVTVPFMHIIDLFLYGETQNAYIVQLNYTGNQRAMLLVVPKRKDGLLAALRDIESIRSFSDLIESLNQTEVELILPKFEIDYEANLIDTLQKLNIRQVFSTDANLSNLLENNLSGLVDRFIHKAKIEVSEEGTEASAVSLVSVIPLMGTSSPKVRVDHPFAFFVYNTHSKTILFEGILNEPQQSVIEETKTVNTYMYPETVIHNQLPTRPLQTQRQLYSINRA